MITMAKVASKGYAKSRRWTNKRKERWVRKWCRERGMKYSDYMNQVKPVLDGEDIDTGKIPVENDDIKDTK